MHRRIKLRRQIAMLLISMRLAYGGSLLVIFWISSNLEGSLLSVIHKQGGIMPHMLSAAIVAAAVMLVVDGLLDTAWPHISASNTEKKWHDCRWLKVAWLHRIRGWLMHGCRLSNIYRHWFYLPPAFAALFTVPAAAYLGAENVGVLQWLWLWLFAVGIGGALVEGAVNNERHRNEK